VGSGTLARLKLLIFPNTLKNNNPLELLIKISKGLSNIRKIRILRYSKRSFS